MARDFEIFGREVKRLKEIEAELASLDTTGFEEEVGSIKSKLKEVSALEEVEREFRSLKKKLKHK